MSAETSVLTPERVDLEPYPFPEAELVRNDWETITAEVAFLAALKMEGTGIIPQILARNPNKDPKEVKKEIIFDIDSESATNIETRISTNDEYDTDVASCEGNKEGDAKKLGKIPRMLKGLYGKGKRKRITVDLDPIENTDAVAYGEPGGMSFAAISTYEGIMHAPVVNGKEIDYMNKLAAPGRMRGKISLDRTPTQNIGAIAEEYGIDPALITVVVLDRERNYGLIDEIEAAGAKVKRISGGDLEPGIVALQEPDNPNEDGIQIVYGSGGWQEGIGKAVAAKAWGAFFEGQTVRNYKKDGNEIFETDEKVLSVDELVPGKKEDCMIVFAAVTPIESYDMPAVDLVNRKVTTFAVDQSEKKGYRIRTHDLSELTPNVPQRLAA